MKDPLVLILLKLESILQSFPRALHLVQGAGYFSRTSHRSYGLSALYNFKLVGQFTFTCRHAVQDFALLFVDIGRLVHSHGLLAKTPAGACPGFSSS